MEPEVDAGYGEQGHDDDLDPQGEDVEAGSGVVPRRLALRPQRQVVGSGAEGRAKRQQKRSGQDSEDFRADGTAAKGLDGHLARADKGVGDDGDGEEGDYGEASPAVELDVPVNVPCVWIEGVE